MESTRERFKMAVKGGTRFNEEARAKCEEPLYAKKARLAYPCRRWTRLPFYALQGKVPDTFGTKH